jgi:hypothetical protein
MERRRGWRLAAWLSIACAGAMQTAGAQQQRDDAVILITLDGARPEEMFGGLDEAVLESTLKDDQRIEDQPIYTRFWAPTREERRRKLMPFFWGTWMTKHGSIAGDASRGSRVSPDVAADRRYPTWRDVAAR